MRTNRSFAIVAGWRGSISFLLLSVLLQACSSSWNPLESVDLPEVQQPPSEPAPPAVSEPPDVPEPPSAPEPPEGGLSPTGALEVSVTGSDAALTLGYAVAIYLSGQPAPWWVSGTGATTRIKNLPQGSHTVVLRPRLGNCVAEDAGPRPFSIVGGETSQIGFTVSCSGVSGFATGVYERITKHYAPTVEFHGTLSERYVISADGSFRLQFVSGRYGSFEYPGAFYLLSSSGSDILLGFVFSDNNGEWVATATLRGKCLIVEYNTDMWLSDFEHGEYCRS